MASVESQLGDGSLNVIIGIVAAFRKRQMSFRKITAYDFWIFLVKFSISAEPLPFQLESRYIQVPIVQAAQETREKTAHQPPICVDTVTCQHRPTIFSFCRGTGNGIYIGGKAIVCLGNIHRPARPA